MTIYKVDFDSLPWESPMKGVRFKALRQNGRQLRLVEYSGDMEPHWCEKGHIGYLLEGSFEITIGEEIHVFHPGDGIFLPPGEGHSHMGKVPSGIARVIFVEDV